MSEVVEKIKEIFEKAIAGTLGYKELYQEWPDQAEGDKFFEKIFTDIQSSVEHRPGKLFSTKPDIDAFRTSYEYFVISLDRVLLEYHTDKNVLLECRDEILREQSYVDSNIKERVEAFLVSRR